MKKTSRSPPPRLPETDAKKFDLFGRKIYSTSSLQFHVVIHQVLLGQYNFILWDGLKKFQDSLPQGLAQEFGTLVEEGMVAARWSLQMAWDAVDSVASVVTSAVVMLCSFWLQTAGLSQER